MRLVICATAEKIPSLRNVNIVLVQPQTPGNIGSVLRAASNFGSGGVSIVAPRCDPYHADVHRLACESPLLHSMQIFPDLREALQDKQSSIGFTRRAGSGRIVHPSLRSLTAAFPGFLQSLQSYRDSTSMLSPYGNVALVFGREESGLLDSEVALCGYACAIPSAPDFPSLNLSHAVAVVLANLFEMTLAEDDDRAALSSRAPVEIASQGEVDALLERIVVLMNRAGMDTRESSGGGDKSNHGRRRRPVGHLAAVLRRAQASTAEVRAMHGILKEIEKKYGGAES